jgi:hypothetical protein
LNRKGRNGKMQRGLEMHEKFRWKWKVGFGWNIDWGQSDRDKSKQGWHGLVAESISVKALPSQQ